MRGILPENLIALANACEKPLYLVGGSVRDFLCGFPPKSAPDWDICSSETEDGLIAAAQKAGFTARAVYRNTGTVKLTDGAGTDCEFTRFRTDRYVRGFHAPAEIFFTDDIGQDARRRDFTCNAVYYDIASGAFCDPLGGIKNIQTKTMRTVSFAKKVFGEDGLRLLRLCRQAAQIGFSPDDECLAGARENADLICDIAPERIFSELQLLLHADEAHGVKDGVLRGLRLLDVTGVLDRILPELAQGRGMAQRSDFHDHTVLEHSFRCAAYAPPRLRIAALLHDVGKPFCMKRDGNFYEHPQEGARISREILQRLKAPKKLTADTERLVLLHMYDFNCAMRENKVRREIVQNFACLQDLLALKQADFTACKGDLSPAPTVEKWKRISEQMQKEGAPRTLAELAINGSDLIANGIPPQKVSAILNELLLYAAQNGEKNIKSALLKHANNVLRNL